MAGECLFPEEEAVNLLEGVGFLKEQNEVSQAERAYQFIVDWIAANENYFDVMFSSKILGKVTKEYCLFNQTELMMVLDDNGFDFNAVKKEWAACRYLERTNDGKYAFLTTVNGKDTKARYVKILFRAPLSVSEYEDYAGEDNPFTEKGEKK